MAVITKLRELIETYGAAVRAGLITPCKTDEAYFRKQLDIPEMPDEVIEDWKDSNGVRRPITLQRPSQTDDGAARSIAADQAANGEV